MNEDQIKAIQKRYPHLIKAMKWAAILCEYEAIYAIRDYKAGEDYSGEAVNHFGGIRAVINSSYKYRLIVSSHISV